jgi:TetR/AcrR family acrAB operon transcriptional repressor
VHPTAPTPTPPSSAAPRGRKADTQARILDAAVALFGARGYGATSIAAIAERAGVSRAAIFWHFTDKGTLFEEAFRAMLVPFVEELKRTIENAAPRERLFELFDVYEAFVSTHRATIESIVRWVFESAELRARLERPLLALLDRFVRDLHGSLADCEPGEDAAALAAALASALHGNLLLSLLDPHPERRAQRTAGLRLLTARMLREPERR